MELFYFSAEALGFSSAATALDDLHPKSLTEVTAAPGHVAPASVDGSAAVNSAASADSSSEGVEAGSTQKKKMH